MKLCLLSCRSTLRISLLPNLKCKITAFYRLTSSQSEIHRQHYRSVVHHCSPTGEDLRPLSVEVLSGLRPLVVWMSNSLELLHFIQFQLPLILEWRTRQEQEKQCDGKEVENLG